MISTFKRLRGCGVCAAIVGVSSLAQAEPPSASPSNAPPEDQPDSPYYVPRNKRISRLPDTTPKAVPYESKELPYEEGQQIPSGYKVDDRARLGLVIPGSILFGLSWGASILVAAGRGATSEEGDSAGTVLFLPVAGPFIFAAQGNGYVAFCVIDGFLQTAGVAMLITGIGAPKKVLVRQDIATITHPQVMVGPRSIGIKFSF